VFAATIVAGWPVKVAQMARLFCKLLVFITLAFSVQPLAFFQTGLTQFD
jgi:hypothetical protein